MKVPSESQEQQKLILKLRWFHDDLVFFSIPNGGKRNKAEAARLKLEGVEPGAPDLFICEPRGRFHGLFIELKRADKTLTHTSEEQKEYHLKLSQRGFKVMVCYGCRDAYEEILDYISQK